MSVHRSIKHVPGIVVPFIRMVVIKCTRYNGTLCGTGIYQLRWYIIICKCTGVDGTLLDSDTELKKLYHLTRYIFTLGSGK